MSPSFGTLGVPSEMVDALTKAGITEPFPIQTATIPEAMTGRDVIAKAPTGSGKTLAFGLPMITRIERARARCPRALVLVPTRELCMQVAEVLRPLAESNGLRVAEVFGGAGYGDQAKQIRRGCDIVVACPGRLGDLLERGQMMLKDVEVVVLDEADRMSDMGFMPDVKKLLSHIVVQHQVLLFSATLEGQVDKFIAQYTKNAFRFETAASQEDKSKAVHMFWQAKTHERVTVTAGLAQRSSSTIIFCRTKHGVDRLTTQLKTEGVKAVAIHGGRTQAQRTRALKSFTDGAVKTLVATDVAARGLHIDDVDCVIHYDQPDDYTDYVHRSGRTARAGATGTVISVITKDQVRKVLALQKSLKMKVSIDEPNWDAVAHLGDKAVVRPERKSSNKFDYDTGDEPSESEDAPKRYSNKGGGRSKNGNRSTGRTSYSKPRGDRDSQSSGRGERKSYGERKTYGRSSGSSARGQSRNESRNESRGESRDGRSRIGSESRGQRKPYGRSEGDARGGERKDTSNRGERKSTGERSTSGDRKGNGQRKTYGRSDGDSRGNGNSNSAGRGQRKTYGRGTSSSRDSQSRSSSEGNGKRRSFNDRSSGKKPEGNIDGNRRSDSGRDGNEPAKKRVFGRGRARSTATNA